MKKLIFFAQLMLIVLAVKPQGNGNGGQNLLWKTVGNSAGGADFLGTTNSQPLIFKTNGLERGRINGGGEFLIGTTNPIANYMLKVGGNSYFEKSLFVQEYITYLKSLNGPRIDVDTIKMDSTRGIYGHTRIFGNVEISQNLNVLGQTNFSGNFTSNKGMLFDATNGITYAKASGTSPAIIQYGIIPGSQIGVPANPMPLVTCFPGYSFLNHQFGGLIQLFEPTQTSTSILTLGATTGGCAIESGKANSGTLLGLNSVCGGDVEICTMTSNNTGLDPGTVHIGRNLEIGNLIRNRNIALNIAGSTDMLGMRVETIHNGDWGYNTIFHVNRNKTKAAAVYCAENGLNETFVVMGDGSMQIRIQNPALTPDAFTVYDNLNQKDLVKIKSDGILYSRGIKVTVNSFPDYVFKPGYVMMSLSELKAYIQKEGHLPNFPTEEEVKKEGMDLAKINQLLVEKIEEMTLRMIELEERLKKLEENSK